MKKIVIGLFCLIISVLSIEQEVVAIDNKDILLPNDNDVYIAEVGIVMPLEKFLLVRKGNNYCAIKFTKFWITNTSEVSTLFVAAGSDKYAMYESYYPRDKANDFSKKNMVVNKAKLSFPKPRGIGRLSFSFGQREVQCNTITLEWFGKSGLYFHGENQKASDYGIELAPTIWTDISQVNFFDQRITWYKYDEKRKRVNIPIDHLWENK